MASEIRDVAKLTETTESKESTTDVPPNDPQVVLAGPKTTVTPRTKTAPRGKIFEDDVRGTVFWEVAESDDDEEADTEGEQLKVDDKWGNPFRIDWIKWYISITAYF